MGFAGRRFSLIISNPPWKEPPRRLVTSADRWAEKMGVPFVRRQIAGAYAIRSAAFLTERGRVCVIVPIAQILGTSSRTFVSYFFRRMQPTLIINFGDLQNLLFPTTESTCHVLVCRRREKSGEESVAFDETFDYCVPKADMSLTYGRLTMFSADRHRVQTVSVIQDPQLLVTLMWGDSNDLALWTRLTTFGTFQDFWKGPRVARRWVYRKGVHLEDSSRAGVSSQQLRNWPFVPMTALGPSSPVLHRSRLVEWPEDRKTVAGVGEELLRVFDGPRVLFSDGFSRQDPVVRAAYTRDPATFTHSIAVIAGSKEDAALLQVAAAYLRSTLAKYFLMMRGWKMLCDRNAVHLKDIEAFPFFDVDGAPDPKAARRARDRIATRMNDLAGLDDVDQVSRYQEDRASYDQDVFEFFSLTDGEQALVQETVDVLMPSIRPRSFRSLDTPAQSVDAVG